MEKLIKAPEGANVKFKRLGRGRSSGKGKTSGRGHKGHKQRAGSSIKLGFEGGQMSLIRRLPKYGFSNARFKNEFAIVRLEQLEKTFDADASIELVTLIEKGLAGKNDALIKVVGTGELTKSLKLGKNIFVTQSARTAIEKVGGSIQELSVKEKKVSDRKDRIEKRKAVKKG